MSLQYFDDAPLDFDAEELKSEQPRSNQSLIIDDKNRTRMDLLQEDFPSAQSAEFSTRLLAEGWLDQLEGITTTKSPRSAASFLKTDANKADANVDGLDDAMKSLYVSDDKSRGNNNDVGSSSPLPSVPRNQNQVSRGVLPGGLPSVDYSSASNYPPQVPQIAGQQQYYVPQQQPVYVDQNGQPIYYRVQQGNQYQQDMVYQNSDGTAAYNLYSQGQINGASNYYGQQVNSDALSQSIQYVTPQGQGQLGQRIYNNANQYGINPNMSAGRGINPYGLQGNLMGSRQNDGDMFNISSRDIDRNRGGINDRNKDPYGSRNHSNNDMYGIRDNGRGMGRDNRDNFNGGGRGNQNQNSSAVNPMRDPLVDEFRSTYGKSRQWGLVDLLGHVVAFCQDQHGSRFIQQRLEVCIDVDKQLIFDEIMPSAHLLMTDVFGNYVLQKLFEFGTPEQCENLANLLTDQSVQLSMQMYGCRVVQKALEYVSTSRLITLVQEFESPPVLLRCVHDANGNHVIQKCIEIVSRVAKEAPTPEMTEYLNSRIQFIIDTFKGRVKELSSHPYGCRVVQRILEHCCNGQKGVVLEELRECCSELVQDCYGNYVIQFVMQHGLEADRQVLIREVQTNLLDFSQHKFASNVVEKCLQYASKRDRDEMIWTIINVTFDLNSPVDAKTGHCVLESMVRDPYANYVVQKVIDVSDERQRSAIMHYVRENIVQLRRYTYGKHIIVRLEKITNEKF